MDQQNFVLEVVGPDVSELDDCYVLPVRDFHPLLVSGQDSARFPRLAEVGHLQRISDFHHIGSLNGDPVIAWEVPLETDPPAGMDFINLRSLFGQVPENLWEAAGRAVQIIDWDRNHRYCGRCGRPTEILNGERARACRECGWRAYPRLSPAVIMAICRGDEILLGRSRRFTSGFHSVLAGFVEPGESLEGAVRREVREEVGLVIDDIHYFGSQPWPFPNSLMIGFTAQYASGDIDYQDDEILTADWFNVDNLPPIPSKISISRALIDWFIEQNGGISPDD